MASPIVTSQQNSDTPRERVSLVAGKHGTPPKANASRPVMTFRVTSPESGQDLPLRYLCASTEDVRKASSQAWEAFYTMRARSPAERADLIERIGRALTNLGEELTHIAAQESGLSPVRIVAERERAAANCEMLAAQIREGSWCEPSIDLGEAARRPTPKPDLRRMLRPLGPVAVLGTASSPIVTGPAGADALSAIAAGCPVVYKAHPQLPGTSLLIAVAIANAIEVTGFHPGCFSLLLAGGSKGNNVTEQLVTNECIRAVGITGSRAVSDRITQLAQTRNDPIPVFALMGGINPVFILPGAVESSIESIAERLFLAITNAAGQTCARPGLIFLSRGGQAEMLTRLMADAMNKLDPQTMVTRDVRRRYIARFNEIAHLSGVELRGGSPQGGHRDSAEADTEDGTPVRASPGLFRTTYASFLQHPALHDEIFGPAGIVVMTDSPDQLVEAAASIQGCMTASIWCHGRDEVLTRRVSMTLDLRAGRLVYNAVPTGVELCNSIVQGGPYPAASQIHASAAGPTSITRWTRPICYQNAPEGLLPQELRDDNPLHVTRLVNGFELRDAISRKRAKPTKRAA